MNFMKWNKDMIRAYRKKLSLTQYQFASLLGTSQDIISNWERGKQKPSGMSRKFLSLIAGVADIEREIEEIKSKKQKGKESEISGEEILALREKLGLSQTEFAERLGRNHSTVSYWESGEISPGKKSLQALKKLASEEGISLEELGKDTESSDSKDCSGDEGCSDSKKSAPQNKASYNIGGANFTADSKNFSSDPDIKTVGAGIDILCYSFYVDVKGEVVNLLEKEKSKAKALVEEGGSSEIPISLGDYTFNLSAYGERVYAYILSNSDLRIKVSRECSMHPSVYVEFKSLFILEKGAEKAVSLTRDFISSNFGEIKQEKLSRVEMYCDIAGVNLSRDDISKFVSLANGNATYNENGKFTGFSFGKGTIIGKVYNKTVEIKTSHKEYMFSIWNLESDSEEVWRIEFELKRRILKEFGVDSFSDFEDVAGDIWKYLTEKWLSMREEDKENTSRRTLTSLWEVVQGVRDFFGSSRGAYRNNKLILDIERSISQIRGLQTSIGAALLKLGNDVSKKKVCSLVEDKISEQLAGVDGEKDFSEEEIEALSEIGFYQEAYRKSVSL